MNDVNISAKGEHGQINISNDVIKTIIGTAMHEVEGVVAPVDHSNSFINRKINFSRGVKIQILDDVVSCVVDIAVELNFDVIKVSKNVQKKIVNTVETMTGLEVGAVDVNIIEVE